jgi:hypothetical protein
LTDVKKLPEDYLKNVETCRNVHGLFVKKHIFLEYSTFGGITW